MLDAPHSSEKSRTKRLRDATHAAHEALDGAITAGRPFASLELYGRFLDVQHAFHRDIDALHRNPGVAALLPDLDGRRRLPQIEQDLSDIKAQPSGPEGGAAFREGEPHDVPTSLGWLYVAEGSNLGAAFLLKEAAKLGLSETFGARHLAPAAEGRGLHWKTFTAALDGVELSEDEDRRVIEGATAAFARVRALVGMAFA